VKLSTEREYLRQSLGGHDLSTSKRGGEFKKSERIPLSVSHEPLEYPGRQCREPLGDEALGCVIVEGAKLVFR
jgi:hypothetical protein